MKKTLVLAATLLLSVLSFAENVVINNIVYSVNVGDLTATVMNFQTSAYEPIAVTIPNQITYKNDIYKVTGLSCYSFDYNALNDYYDKQNKKYKDYEAAVAFLGVESALTLSLLKDLLDDSPNRLNTDREERESKFRYNYDEARANIVELHLPSTLEYIGHDAFKGMTRLKRITIPANVNVLSADNFGGNARLEYISILGIPYFSEHYYSSDKICLYNFDNPAAVIDSVRNNWKRNGCPKLQKIEVLPLKDYLLYKKKLEKLYIQYNHQLKDTVCKYKQDLESHPFYIENNYFQHITLQKPKLSTSYKADFANQSKGLKKDYNRQLALCREIYQEANSRMEQLCKTKYPDLYAEKYCALHPDFSAKIDSMLYDYKCKYTKNKLAQLVLSNYGLGPKCQDELWWNNSYLFKSKEAFLEFYDKSTDVNDDIIQRNRLYIRLRDQIKMSRIPTKGFYDSSNETNIAKTFRNNYDNLKRNGVPVSKEIIAQDPKALKEFEKNGKYFDDADDFFAAYITSNYSQILKQKKKAKK